MVGVVIPIHFEGGDTTTISAAADEGEIKCIKNRSEIIIFISW